MRKIIIALVAAFGLALALPVAAAADEDAVDYCDPTQKPSGSIKSWLEDNGEVPGGCVDFTVTVQCGQLDVALTNETGLFYEVRALVDASPAYMGGEGVNTFPVTFDEDEFDGSVDVSVWVEGGESDYLTDSGVPNFWDANAAMQAVDTDCIEPTSTPTPAPTPTPTPTVTATADPTPTETSEPTSEPEPTDGATPVASQETLPETGASTVVWLVVLGVALILFGAGAVVLRRT